MPPLDTVVAAAGAGRRMGSKTPKQYLQLGGMTILERTLRALSASPLVGRLIVVISPEDGYFQDLDLSFLQDRLITAAGGCERMHSVYNGLKLCTGEFVMVHDAARPFISVPEIAALYEQAVLNPAGGILACPVSDTLKLADERGEIVRTVPRTMMYRAQTPQLFRRELLLEPQIQGMAYPEQITDEASALERLGYHPCLVKGSSANFKITDPADYALARALIELQDLN